MSGMYQQNAIATVISDKEIEQLLKDTERTQEQASCLDDVELTDIDQELFYEEVTCKRKCYAGMD